MGNRELIVIEEAVDIAMSYLQDMADDAGFYVAETTLREDIRRDMHSQRAMDLNEF